MRAGGLRECKLWIQRPVIVRDEFGAEHTEWEDRAIVRGQLNRFSGARSDEAGEHWSNYTAEYYVRYATPVCENDRVRDLFGPDDLTYVVVAITTNRLKGMKAISCERINE